MGQDGEDRKDDGPDVTIELGRRRLGRRVLHGRHRRRPGVRVEPGGLRQPEAFRKEIRAAVRYERGLVVKAAALLVLIAVLIVLRTLYFA